MSTVMHLVNVANERTRETRAPKMEQNGTEAPQCECVIGRMFLVLSSLAYTPTAHPPRAGTASASPSLLLRYLSPWLRHDRMHAPLPASHKQYCPTVSWRRRALIRTTWYAPSSSVCSTLLTHPRELPGSEGSQHAVEAEVGRHSADVGDRVVGPDRQRI